jgi:hypothetical protein
VKVEDEAQIKHVGCCNGFLQKAYWLILTLWSFVRLKLPESFIFVTKRITSAQSYLLQVEITKAEIQATDFSMKNDKTPGPDGCQSFLRSLGLWLGMMCLLPLRVSLSLSLSLSLSSWRLLKSANANIITLVPNKAIPSKMGYFCPTSLCNLIYKCMRGF